MNDIAQCKPTPAGRGQIAVLTMIGVAIAAAAFGWWWNFKSGERAMEFYGPAAATLIRTAPRVEFRASGSHTYLDISKAPGLLNARTALLSDASYEWVRPSPELDSPQFAVRFSDGDRSVVITFDFESRAIGVSSTNRTATLIERTADGWQSYLQRQAKAGGSEAKIPGGLTPPRSPAQATWANT